jgi:hypothetical protein
MSSKDNGEGMNHDRIVDFAAYCRSREARGARKPAEPPVRLWEVRQTGDDMSWMGIPDGSAVAILSGTLIDYEPDDLVLVRRRGTDGVGCLAVFEGLNSGLHEGTGAMVLRAHENKPCVSGANQIELRGRTPRSHAEAMHYQAWRDFYEERGGR